MSETTANERLDNLHDELYDCLTTLIHYYKGMLRDLAGDSYTHERAWQDWTALFYNEGHDVLAVLSEMLVVGSGKEMQESDKGGVVT